MDAAHPVLPLQAALPRAVPVELVVVVGVLPVVPELLVVSQVVARPEYPVAVDASEQVAAQAPSWAYLEQKSLEPLLARAQQVQPPVLKPEQVPQVSPQVQT